jgi:hypothetical protein
MFPSYKENTIVYRIISTEKHKYKLTISFDKYPHIYIKNLKNIHIKVGNKWLYIKSNHKIQNIEVKRKQVGIIIELLGLGFISLGEEKEVNPFNLYRQHKKFLKKLERIAKKISVNPYLKSIYIYGIYVFRALIHQGSLGTYILRSPYTEDKNLAFYEDIYWLSLIGINVKEIKEIIPDIDDIIKKTIIFLSLGGHCNGSFPYAIKGNEAEYKSFYSLSPAFFSLLVYEYIKKTKDYSILKDTSPCRKEGYFITNSIHKKIKYNSPITIWDRIKRGMLFYKQKDIDNDFLVESYYNPISGIRKNAFLPYKDLWVNAIYLGALKSSALIGKDIGDSTFIRFIEWYEKGKNSFLDTFWDKDKDTLIPYKGLLSKINSSFLDVSITSFLDIIPRYKQKLVYNYLLYKNLHPKPLTLYSRYNSFHKFNFIYSVYPPLKFVFWKIEYYKNSITEGKIEIPYLDALFSFMAFRFDNERTAFKILSNFYKLSLENGIIGFPKFISLDRKTKNIIYGKSLFPLYIIATKDNIF